MLTDPRRGFPWTAGIALVALSLLTAEYMSGNVSFPRILFPTNLIFLTLAYGFPVLLIREAQVRLDLGGRGVFLLGWAYGVINEGLLAKTLTLSHGVPIGLFDVFPLTWGIHLPWAAFILTYHAWAAIALPLLVVHHLFPRERGRPWLSKRAVVALALVLLVLCVATFFLGKTPHPRGNPVHFPLYLGFIALMATLAVVSARGRRPGRAHFVQDSAESGQPPFAKEPAPGLRHFFAGALTSIAVFPATLVWLSKGRPSAGAFILVFLAILGLGAFWLHRMTRGTHGGATLPFALGIVVPFGAIRVIAGIQHGRPIEGAVAAALFLAGAGILIWRIRRANTKIIPAGRAP